MRWDQLFFDMAIAAGTAMAIHHHGYDVATFIFVFGLLAKLERNAR
jgi:hypothetical protein